MSFKFLPIEEYRLTYYAHAYAKHDDKFEDDEIINIIEKAKSDPVEDRLETLRDTYYGTFYPFFQRHRKAIPLNKFRIKVPTQQTRTVYLDEEDVWNMIVELRIDGYNYFVEDAPITNLYTGSGYFTDHEGDEVFQYIIGIEYIVVNNG